MPKPMSILALALLILLAGGLVFYRFSQRPKNTLSPVVTEKASAPTLSGSEAAKSKTTSPEPSPVPHKALSVQEKYPSLPNAKREIPMPQLSDTLKAALEANRLSQKADPDSDAKAIEILRAWAAQPVGPASVPCALPQRGSGVSPDYARTPPAQPVSSPPTKHPATPDQDMDPHAEHLFLLAWENLQARHPLGDIQPLILGRFLESRTLSVRQKLLRLLDAHGDPTTQAMIQTRMDEDLKRPPAPPNLATHQGLIWVAAAVQNGQHARALELAGKMNVAPNDPGAVLLEWVRTTLKHALAAKEGSWDPAQAGRLFAQAETLTLHPAIHSTLGALVLDSTIHALEKAMGQPAGEGDKLVRGWMEASATGDKKAMTLWGWAFERIKAGPLDGPRFAHLRAWVQAYVQVFNEKDYAYGFWESLAAAEKPDGRFQRPGAEELYRAALAEAQDDGQRLATLRKMAELYIKERRLEDGQALLREEQTKMATAEGRDGLLEVLADFDRQSAETANESVREAKENKRRVKEGQLKFFQERLAEAERRKASDEDIRSLRAKVKEAEESLPEGF